MEIHQRVQKLLQSLFYVVVQHVDTETTTLVSWTYSDPVGSEKTYLEGCSIPEVPMQEGPYPTFFAYVKSCIQKIYPDNYLIIYTEKKGEGERERERPDDHPRRPPSREARTHVGEPNPATTCAAWLCVCVCVYFFRSCWWRLTLQACCKCAGMGPQRSAPRLSAAGPPVL